MTGFSDVGSSGKKREHASIKGKDKKLQIQGIQYLMRGDSLNAEKALRKAFKNGHIDDSGLVNLGAICQASRRYKEAIFYYKNALEINPREHRAFANLGSTHYEMGDLDKALLLSLKSLEMQNRDNYPAIQSIKLIIEKIRLSERNGKHVEKAYEILLFRKDIFHKVRLAKIFNQAFLSEIRNASKSSVIIHNNNNSFKSLALDWRFRKSLTLFTPLHPEVEVFLAKLRKELLFYSIDNDIIPVQLKELTEALAIQCFLNEYVYLTSDLEKQSIEVLIRQGLDSQESVNRNLAIIGCYRPLHKLKINERLIQGYYAANETSRALLEDQIYCPLQDEDVKLRINKETSNINDKTSLLVQKMYEENPYPRFKYSEYTQQKYSSTIPDVIKNETVRTNMTFNKDLFLSEYEPKVLIAGCGTGHQVIRASRYKNARITAIDISKSSLAYAIRKSKEYQLDNVIFRQLDLLDSSILDESFDIIECVGVLHHLEVPVNGLRSLITQLKPGGYIYMGLYSKLARSLITAVRKKIEELNIECTSENIKMFRDKILNGEIEELGELPLFAGDFFSLSEFRDLCFHVQEHQYSTEEIEGLLKSVNLEFCGFVLSSDFRKHYLNNHPEDNEMTSLENWGHFELNNPKTFKGMYKFWARKEM